MSQVSAAAVSVANELRKVSTSAALQQCSPANPDTPQLRFHDGNNCSCKFGTDKEFAKACSCK